MFENDINGNQLREYNLRLGDYPVRVDEVNSTLVYVGYTQNLGVDTSLERWKIKKIEKVGSVWEIKWADGDELYDNIWDNRASLNYK
jgi:hypothetical protein